MMASTPGKPIPMPDNPSIVPLGEWYHRGWQVQATCVCGRVSIIHRGELIRRYGDMALFNAERLSSIPVKCLRCGDRHPKLEIVVERD